MAFVTKSLVNSHEIWYTIFTFKYSLVYHIFKKPHHAQGMMLVVDE